MNSAQRLFLCLALAVCCQLPASALAVDAPATFTLPPQPLDRALLQLSRQAGLQILFPANTTRNLHSEGMVQVEGLETALEVLLKGTGLGYHFSDPQTLVIAALEQEPEVDRGYPRLPAEEVLVTGSFLRRDFSLQSLSPASMLAGDSLRMEGHIELPYALQSLPATSGAEVQVNNLNQPLTAGTAAINLRNLGPGNTLVLLNGQRQVDAPVATTEGETFVDVNALLPAIAVERVEILRDGASATYGSDAVAGVINLVPRYDFSGAELHLRYGATSRSKQHSSNVAALLGGALPWTGARGTLALSMERQSALLTTDRDFPDRSVLSILGQPGTYLGSEGFVRDPGCLAGGGEISPDLPFCLFDSSPYFDLSPEQRRQRLHVHVEQALAGGDTQLSLTVNHHRAEVWVRASPSFPFANTLPRVPEHNPGNDFGEPVFFYGRVLGQEAGASRSRSRYQSDFARLELSRYDDDITLGAGLNFSDSRTRYGRTDTVRDRLQAALNGQPLKGGSGYWNPRHGASNDPAVVEGLFADWGMRGRARLASLDLFAANDHLPLMGRTLGLAMGAQFRREWLSQTFSQTYNDKQFLSLGGGPDFHGKRDTTSLYAEALTDLSSTLELQLAARYEHAGGASSALSPKLALRWELSERNVLQASWSRAFRAPSLFQTRGSQAVPVAITDESSAGTPLFANVITSGDPSLSPSTADVLTAGIAHRRTDGTYAELDLWFYDYRDVVLKELPQGILERASEGDSDALAKVSRDPSTGQITEIRADFVNAADIRTYGVDGTLGARLPWAGGELDAGMTWTWTERFAIDDRQSRQRIEGAGSRNATSAAARALPRLKGYAWLQWRDQDFSLRTRINGVSGFRDDRKPGRHIGGQVTADLHLSWERLLPGAGALSLGVFNIGDRDPPHVDAFLGYDARTHDPRGRVWYLSAQWQRP